MPGGIVAEAEPWGDEAMAFVKEMILQREVEIEVEQIDKGGNFVGYHGDIGTLVKQEFNFTLTLEPIQSYGLKIGDNNYTGTVNELYKNKIDIGMYCKI